MATALLVMRCMDLLASFVLVGLAIYCSVGFVKGWPLSHLIWLAAANAFLSAASSVLRSS